MLSHESSMKDLDTQLLVYEKSRFGGDDYKKENFNALKTAFGRSKNSLKQLKGKILIEKSQGN